MSRPLDNVPVCFKWMFKWNTKSPSVPGVYGQIQEFWALVLFLSSREKGSCACVRARLRDRIDVAPIDN